MPSRIRFLNIIRRKNSEKLTKTVSLGFLKDIIICNIQPIFSGREIVDIDFSNTDPVEMSIYLKKEVRKK
jgi:hypothetical protein